MDFSMLKALLETPRAHDSIGERAVGRMLVNTFGFTEYQDHTKYPLAYVRRIGGSKILWSCHIDTVHDDDAGTSQEIEFDTDLMIASIPDKAVKRTPLGADNGAGVWMLLQMVIAEVPGTYIFHRGEEVGGVGSEGMADNWPKLIAEHTHAIAFDRRGTTDVITHQWGGRCCSEKFALQMAGLLGDGYMPDDTGSFTDTANYTKLVPECTNISVGYDHEHSSLETLDLEHLATLRNRVITLFKEPSFELIVARKVTDRDDDRYSYYSSYGVGYGDYGMSNRESVNYDSPVKGNGGKKNKKKKKEQHVKLLEHYDESYIDPSHMDESDILDMSIVGLRNRMRQDIEGYSDLMFRMAEEVVYVRRLAESSIYEEQGYDDRLTPEEVAELRRRSAAGLVDEDDDEKEADRLSNLDRG
jgi:hypothetical protein